MRLRRTLVRLLPHPATNPLQVRGYVRTDEAVAFFTFVRLDLSPKAIDSAMEQLIALSSEEKEDQMVVPPLL